MRPHLLPGTLAAVIVAVASTAQALWPIPASYQDGKIGVEIKRSDFMIKANVTSSSVINAAIERYQYLIEHEYFESPYDFNESTLKTSGMLYALEVDVQSSQDVLDLETDESYTLDVPIEGKAVISAKTPFGAVRGLESFSQLIVSNTGRKIIKNAPIKIVDAPKFPHRGVLLDTSRNFYHIDAILRTLDAMAYNKLNTLHWYAVGAFSWPIESKVHPELNEKGAYSLDMRYSYDDVKKVINYAKNRAIRVMPEFDMPGSTFVVGEAHPEIMSCLNKQPNWDKFTAEPPSGQLNIADPRAVTFAFDVLSEYSRLFVDLGFHMGGGSLNLECWRSDPTIELYVRDHPGESVESLMVGWYAQMIGKISDLGKIPHLREEAVLNFNLTAKNTTIIQAWVNEDSVSKVVDKGYRVIASPWNRYYLDCGHGSWLSNFEGNSWCDPFKGWQQMYSYNPLTNITEPEKQKLVLGGEVALWSAQSDETTVDRYLWPRASAFAEIMWSGNIDPITNTTRDVAKVAPRLTEHRFRMVARGIMAEPIAPLWCVRHPEACMHAVAP
ncbi:Glucosamine-6-phosphate isomerase (Glucosamine-6-phosphate deaminase) (GNPDA) (GlcN6P deaminase) [Coemansia sp. S16]|nr:Glucosamine-6-phosphate isomerase (Glucosamine-6-phosphate deaminase) (GNPDA) (GlcN6P deaminase) [Coemansia sp. S17]KAJ2037184.1 Glucosamine-6-phosphate isomerase (Glucosamine-6-phosphate deaminase) (GNPDA) (GlcN6P deaminase) [Coemansia sp. S3946]KAJ2045192.1 Glucosamine-6-phosphate isomerase (Glucosamine-6-phosphate deaminase) (GNPDA) (GlcN6P deaminase) [Coemansia sp. S16]KAJ2097989.1 Glucosamine-6-phosphate isomerase (Glucosamine-6-phosphate deaminase) (GNPDA) (GlcN6P deaminase) [Coemansia 